MSRHPGFSIAGAVALLLLLATATVAAATLLEVPRCDGLKLRSGPSTSETVRAVVGTRTTLTVDRQVSGSPWQTLCAGHLLSGSTWARISAVGGKTVESQFGVPYVYAAAGLLQPLASASPTAPRASPTPQPTLAPPTAPATEAPSASPTLSAAPPTVPAATPTASARQSVPAAGPVTTQTSSPSDPLISPAATIVLVLAVLSTMLSWFAVADRRRRRARRMPVPEAVPASRLEDALH